MAITGTYLQNPGTFLLGALFEYWVIAAFFTLFITSGIVNAFNLIDGLNGLSGSVALVAAAGIAAVSYNAGLNHITLPATVIGGALIGFMMLNFPFGKIFLGDGGAFFLGFLVAQIAIMLPMRNPEVSPWVSLLICAYPVVEVLYSMVRRIRENRPSGSPDDEHLHTLIKVKFIRIYFSQLSTDRCNPLVAPLVWVVVAILVVIASLWSDRQMVLVLSFGLFVLAYHLMYRWLLGREMPSSGVESGN
jgi:UDP-N-acetylmuramyl pentapeptide phosphotransferase/UDP-N-acetylglucosamine-1-phosphate transferase